jgi:hypothetical protein
MNRTRRTITVGLCLSSVLGLVDATAADDKDKDKGQGKAKGKHKHHNGKNLLGDKIKTNGNHVLEKNGPATVSVDTKDGKIAGFHAKHDKKGELPIKKYKTNKQMAQARGGVQYAYYQPVQYLGTTWIGYSYYDDYGYEEIYWYPYDMILDGDTGAIEYVPVY